MRNEIVLRSYDLCLSHTIKVFIRMKLDAHVLTYLVLGLAFIGLNWLPVIRKDRFRFLPVHFLYVVVGFGLFYSVFAHYLPDPARIHSHALFIEYSTELIIIISLLTCGIALDRPCTLSEWSTPIRLLGIAMPLTILMIGYLAAWLLEMPLAQACLIAACLAPTDPVLASEVQVSAPNEGGESEDRFGLTSEAGLNDGLAFPFVHLALGLAAYGATEHEIMHWLSYDVAYRVAAGVIIGIIIGRSIAYYVFKSVSDHKNPNSDEGLIVMAAIFLSYGLAELFNGYGFLAVFCAAVAGRQREKKHRYHKKPYHFAKQSEDLLLGLLLLGLGGLTITYWESIMSWQSIAFALVVILIIRPLSAYVGLIRSKTLDGERAFICRKLSCSFFNAL